MKKWYRSVWRILCKTAVLCLLFLFTLTLCLPYPVYGQDGVLAVIAQNEGGKEAQKALDTSLHAKAAVLMDGDSGRILYGKNANQILPMASTTKIMTLLVALEHASPDDRVSVSAYAASMPDVQLGIREGEQYILKDLMYSMMLESHNDSAVAIAEHVGGSVENFARMMNQKAKALGCTNTYFITPNGLDADDENGEHATTAAELALIMRYAILNESFLEITRTSYYSFDDVNKTRSFTVNNKNALLSMTNEALSGKTGFTGKAGYCYVCAVQSEDRTFIISLLGCGWPPNKSWKWKDTMALLDYAKDQYELKEAGIENWAFEPVIIEDGVKPRAFLYCASKKVKFLLGKHETFEIRKSIVSQTRAPVIAGKCAGAVEYVVNGQVLYRYLVVFKESVDAADYLYYLKKAAALALSF